MDIRRSLPLLILVSTTALAGPEIPYEDRAGVFLDGRRVGSAAYSLEFDPDGGYLVEASLDLKILMMGQSRSISQTSIVQVDRGFKLLSFTTSFRSEDSRFDGDGAMIAPDKLRLRMATGGGSSERIVDVPPDVLVDVAVEAFIALNLDRLGDRTIVPAFEPVTGLIDSVMIEKLPGELVASAGGEIEARPFLLSSASGPSRLWLSDSGRLIREVGPLGLELVAETERETVDAVEERPQVDFLKAFAVKADHAIDEPRRAKRLRVRLDAPDDIEWVPTGARQRWLDKNGRVLEVLAGDVDAEPEMGRREAESFLEPEPFVQSDDPRIVERAELIAAGVRRDVDKVERVVEWVHHALIQTPTVTLPSAVDVLKAGRGDCNEHTVLAVALLRALGVPSRQVFGVVYDSGWFYYHAWPEVYIDGWRGVEPTWGYLWADATHLKLAQGGPAGQMNLIRAMNRLRLTIVSIQ